MVIKLDKGQLKRWLPSVLFRGESGMIINVRDAQWRKMFFVLTTTGGRICDQFYF